MKRKGFIFCCLLFCTSVYAQDKLDMLDMQSQEFFKAITGLEKEYFQTQAIGIATKTQGRGGVTTQSKTQAIGIESEYNVNPDNTIRNVFNEANEVARIKTDFAKISAFANLKITSMYTFNGHNYVVFELSTTTSSAQTSNNESTFTIDGRYKKGDILLGHKIIDVNTRTKKVELYRSIDEEYGYSVYLSNHGASISDLQENKKDTNVQTVDKNKTTLDLNKKEQVVEVVPANKEKQIEENISIKEAFSSVETAKDLKTENINTDNSECLYSVNVYGLNVRNTNSIEGTILRILRENDKFSIIKSEGNWALIDTVYKSTSGDIMDVSNDSNWVYITNTNVSFNSNCKGE